MKTTIPSLVCIATIAILIPDAEAGKPRKPKFVPPAAPTPAGAPSADLSRFVGANLERILGPLDQKVPLPRAELAQMRASFAGRFSKASLAERTQFQSALAVCDALSQAMDERDKATLNPAGSNWAQRSAQLRTNIEQLLEREKAAESGAASPTR